MGERKGVMGTGRGKWEGDIRRKRIPGESKWTISDKKIIDGMLSNRR